MNDRIYQLFINYFDNPKLKKVENKNGLSVYMAKCSSLLSTTQRYLIVMRSQDTMMLGTVVPLSDIRWTSLQTRAIPLVKQVPIFSYTPKSGGDYAHRLHRVTDNEQYAKYQAENLPLDITLLYENTSLNLYPQNGFLNSALETYNTIVQIKN